MTDETTCATSDAPSGNPDGSSPSPREDDSAANPIERLNLVASLGLVHARLSDIEVRLKSKSPEAGAPAKTWIELTKVVLGGWPAFGLIFMLLFYVPIRDAINVIPEKVRSANEIGVLGVSLKSTIRAEAEKAGSLQLSETLPTLSPEAVEFLLRGSYSYNSLVSFSDPRDGSKSIWLPSEQTLRILDELHTKKLVAIQVEDDREANPVVLRASISKLRDRYPGTLSSLSNEAQQRWHLTVPEAMQVPSLAWRLTDLGENAVGIILKAVSAQLAPKLQR